MTVTLNLDVASTDAKVRHSLADLSLSVAKSKRIVVVTGAGISCSCGIPDFRSSDGLYALVKKQYPDAVLKGRDLFDASLFRDPTSTSVFYTFIAELKREIDRASPAPTHRFIKTLSNKGKLLRSYTQNIDGLEEKAGLTCSSAEEAKNTNRGKTKIRCKDVKNVQLHGDIHRVRCTFCSAEYPCTEAHLSIFVTGAPPECPDCAVRSAARVARSARPLKIGTLRPAIVLYDEPHPLGDDIGSIQTTDLGRRPDMMIIMGTSLKVHGLRRLVKEFARVIHGDSSAPRAKAGKVIFVNKTAPSGEWADVIDYHVAGETDAWVSKVLADWKERRPQDWEVQSSLVDSNGQLKTVKATSKTGTKASKKNAVSNAENIPPVPRPTNDGAAPASPGKRRLDNPHYCELTSSPSKKRSGKPVIDDGIPESRGLLFGNSVTNIQADDNGDVFGSRLSRKALPVRIAATNNDSFGSLMKIG